jgi:hypothetical protein
MQKLNGVYTLGALTVIGSAMLSGTAKGALHWINDASQSVITSINPGPFVTNFKGVNDVVLAELTGDVTTVATVNFGGPTPGNNPTDLVNFVGAAANGTGDGTAGHLQMLATASGGGAPSSFRFDFAQGFGTGDRFLITDVDTNEQYTIQAFVKIGASYIQVPVAGWTLIPYSGQMGVLPDSRWPTWNGANGTLTSTGANASFALDEPLDVLIPDQRIDRLIFSQTGGFTSGTAEVQFVPEPTGAVVLFPVIISRLVRRRRGAQSDQKCTCEIS